MSKEYLSYWSYPRVEDEKMTQHDEWAKTIFDELKAVLGPLYSKHLDRVLDVDDVLDAVHIATDDEAGRFKETKDELDLEKLKRRGSFITKEDSYALIDEVETLREWVAKLNGWLNEHEVALAKLRREVNDMNREAETVEALNKEMLAALQRSLTVIRGDSLLDHIHQVQAVIKKALP